MHTVNFQFKFNACSMNVIVHKELDLFHNIIIIAAAAYQNNGINFLKFHWVAIRS